MAISAIAALSATPTFPCPDRLLPDVVEVGVAAAAKPTVGVDVAELDVEVTTPIVTLSCAMVVVSLAVLEGIDTGAMTGSGI